MTDARQGAIDVLIRESNKTYGPNSIVRGSQIKDQVIERATSGSLAIDIALGGGWPLNQWNEIVGQNSSGKTVVAMKTIAANQELDPEYLTLWVASERFVGEWAQLAGMDLDRVVLVTTNIMEEAFQIVVDALKTRAFDAIVIDSLPVLVPGPEAEKNVADAGVALGAKLIAKFLRKANNAGRRDLVEDDRPWLGIIINQFRLKIGVMFGDPRTTPGGEAKNYDFFTRVEISRDEWLTDTVSDEEDKKSKKKVGIAIKAKVIKNKTAPAQRVATVDFYFDKASGFGPGEYDLSKEMFFIAVEYGIIERRKNTYYYGDEKLGVKADALLTLRSTLDLSDAIDKEIRRVTTPGAGESIPGDDEAASSD